MGFAMSFSRSGFASCFAVALLSLIGPASAQFSDWPDMFSDRPGARAARDEEDEDASFRRRRRAPTHGERRRDEEPDRGRHARSRAGTRVAALPPDADPAYSTPVDHDDEIDRRQSRRRFVADPTGEAAGTLTINTRARRLYLSLADGRAVEYAIGVGRAGFTWKGEAQIGRKAFWPGWTPPPEMLERRPDLPDHMDGGLDNPLGARALYLFQGAKDTLFRIHGTNEPQSIGRAVSSGCIRMLNTDVIDLYDRVAKGARVVVR
jgi:lipoprotein-anchoring transpeptidase ErfK/SrfK